MRWTEYAVAMLLFSGVSMTLLYLIERTQKWLPFNPQKFPNVEPGVGLRHGGVVHHQHQLAGVQRRIDDELSHADGGLGLSQFCRPRPSGIVLAIVVIRGIARKETDKLGNFWVDTTRCLLWVLLPVCLVGSLVLVSQGVVQNFKPYTTVDLIRAVHSASHGTGRKNHAHKRSRNK